MTKKQKLRHTDNNVSGYGTWIAAGVKKGLDDLYYGAFTRGDWMGQSWSDGKRQDSVVGYATAHNHGDQMSKTHDIEIAKGKRHRDDIDQDFINGMKGTGFTNSLAAAAVSADRIRRIPKHRGAHGMGKQRGIQGEWRTPAKIKEPSFTKMNEKISAAKAKINQSKKGQPTSGIAKDLFGPGPSAPTPALVKKSPSAMNNGDEVPVSKVPRNISKIHPDHYTIRLPYLTKLEVQGSSIGYTNSRPVALIRLNSIYDPIMQHHGGHSYSTTTGIKSANEVQQAGYHDIDKSPQGRDIWAAHFKYYRVLRSDVKITFLNKFCAGCAVTSPAKPMSDTSAYNNAFAVGYELMDEDSLTCNNCNMFLMAKHVVRDMLGPAQVGWVFNSGTLEADWVPSSPNSHTMQYTYTPESWVHHIEQSTQDTKWTAVGANPSLDHILGIRAFHMNESIPLPRPSANYWFGVMIQIEYEVQFKECLDNFYKVENQATVTYTDVGADVDGSAYTP